MIDDIREFEIFILLSSLGSVQQVADALGIDKSTASRKLALLEKKLGIELFEHGRRPLVMNRNAHSIYASAKKILIEKQYIEDFCRRLRHTGEKTIRLMIGNAHIFFAPKLLAEYSLLKPSISFDVISPTDAQDFIDGKADVINLSGQAQLTNCVLIPRGHMVFIPVASPKYLKKHGQIHHPEQLKNHRVFSNLYSSRYDFDISYRLVKGNVSMDVKAVYNIRFSNICMTREAVLNGDGIALSLPLFLCIDDLEQGRLVPILNGWHRPSHINYVAYKKQDKNNSVIVDFANWWASKLTKYEKECETRLVNLYDQNFLKNLLK